MTAVGIMMGAKTVGFEEDIGVDVLESGAVVVLVVVIVSFFVLFNQSDLKTS